MTDIERIKLVLENHIWRETHYPPMDVMCLHTISAVKFLKEWFPKLNDNAVLKILAEEIYIKNGKYTSFIWGKTSAARRILKLINYE